MSSSFIDRVRDIASVKELAEGMTELHGHGGKFTGKCPFHTEDTASFTVYPDSNHFHCFGCGRHGSAFDLIMLAENLDFWEAVVRLAGKYNIPLPEMTPEAKEAHIREQQVQDFLGKFVERSADKLKKHPEVLEYLHKEGVTDASIEQYCIGYGMKVSESANKELAIASGLLVKAQSGKLWQPMLDRIIFPIKRHGKVIQISARKTADKNEDKKCPKFFLLNGRDGYPFNAHQLRKDRVFLTEGAKDAILLEQAGFSACATIMISSKFKPEWLKLVGKETDCYVVNDGDSAGDTANKNISERLFDAGHKVYVIELPKGHDPASFIRDKGAGAFQELVDGAPSYIDFLIERVAPDLNSHNLDKELEFIFSKLLSKSESSQGRYIAKLASHLKLTKASIKNDLAAYIRKSKARSFDNLEESEESFAIKWRTTDPTSFNPAQDVVNGTLYYTIYLQVETGAFIPFIISSNKECFRLTRDALLERDFICDNSAVPINARRWSIGTETPYNVRQYLDGKGHTDAKELFESIKWYFERFLRFPDKFYYDFLTLWVMATYHFRLYDAFGYIFLSAVKGSGKTQALTIIEWLAHNSKKADAVTEAGLKRLVNANSCTLINDEAERLKKKSEKDESNLLEIWNGGYKKSGRAILVNKESLSVEEYCTYSPKALANTMGLDNVLEDRCITLYCQKDIRKIPQLIEDKQRRRIAELRNMLYCFSLEHIEGISEIKESIERVEELSGREWELWQPVLVLAKFLDSFNVVEEKEFQMVDGTSKVINSLFGRMTAMAINCRNYKIQLEEEINPQIKVLSAIWQYVNDNRTMDNLYSAKALQAMIKEEVGWERLPARTLSHFIFEDLHLCKDRSIDRPRVMVNGKRVFYYRLLPEIIKERAKQMFGIDLTKSESDPYDDDERNPFNEE